jgi:hypothetical protein
VISQRHFSERNDEDFRIATGLCEALGWDIHIERQSDSPFYSEIEKNRIFECLTYEHSWFIPSANRILKHGIQYAFDGIAGDVLSNGLFCRREWIELCIAGKIDGFFQKIRRKGLDEESLNSLLSPEYARRWNNEIAIAHMKSEMLKYIDEDDPPSKFFFWNRTRREISPFLQRYLPGVEVITPYLVCNVFDFLNSLPVNIVEDRKFHDDAINSAAPHFSHLEYENKTIPSDFKYHNAEILRGMSRRKTYWFGGDILNRRWLRVRLARAVLGKKTFRHGNWYVGWAAWLEHLERLVES